jgi:hypothetical protein
MEQLDQAMVLIPVKPQVGNLKAGSHRNNTWMIMLHPQALQRITLLSLPPGLQASQSPVEKAIQVIQAIHNNGAHPTGMSLMDHISFCNGRLQNI